MANLDGVSFSWLRLFSSYGPKDDPSWLVPYVALTLLAGKEPALTRAEQRWDYIFVEDVAAAVIAALDSPAAGVFNLGSGEARPLRDIICQVRDLVDPALSLGFGKVDYRPDQVMYLEADITELSTKTGWRPVVPLTSGLKSTVEWYRKWQGAKNDTQGRTVPTLR
jgi:nucleoside-diphosphate-sugar epimerase